MPQDKGERRIEDRPRGASAIADDDDDNKEWKFLTAVDDIIDPIEFFPVVDQRAPCSACS